MKFSEYQQAAAETAIYPDAGTGSPAALSYLGLGLGEAGEIQGKIKKILRDGDTELARHQIGFEVGDLLWYAAMLARELGFDLDAIAKANLYKLTSRKQRGVLGGSGDDR